MAVSLKDAQAKLDELRAKAAGVFEEAKVEGGGYDYTLVKSIEGDGDRVGEKMGEWQKEINELAETVRDQRKMEADHLALQDGIDDDTKPRRRPTAVQAKAELDVPVGYKANGAPMKLGDYFGDVKGIAEAVANTNFRTGKLKLEIPFDPYGLKTLFQTSDGWDPENQRTGRIAFAPIREGNIIANLLPSSPTNQDAVLFMRETITTPAAAERAEAAAYAEADISYAQDSETVESVGVSLPITDEQIEDVPAIMGLLNGRLSMLLARRVDGQILTGDGSTPNLLGTNNVGSIQTQAKGADSQPDAIYKLFTKIRTAGFAEPSQVFMHPNDWQDIRLLTTSDGVYIFGSPMDAVAPRIWGVPVLETTAATENTATAGDYAVHSELRIRRSVTVEVGLDSDDFTKGKQHIRAGLRMAVIHYRPEAFGVVTGL